MKEQSIKCKTNHLGDLSPDGYIKQEGKTMKIKAIITIIGIISVFTFISNIESHYTREGIVTEITDEVVITDTTGNEWCVDNEELYMTGDEVIMLMYDNKTNDITDDEIIEIKEV